METTSFAGLRRSFEQNLRSDLTEIRVGWGAVPFAQHYTKRWEERACDAEERAVCAVQTESKDQGSRLTIFESKFLVFLMRLVPHVSCNQ